MQYTFKLISSLLTFCLGSSNSIYGFSLQPPKVIDHFTCFSWPFNFMFTSPSRNPGDVVIYLSSFRLMFMHFLGMVTSLVTKRDQTLAIQLEEAMRKGESLEGLTNSREKLANIKKKEIEEKRKAKAQKLGVSLKYSNTQGSKTKSSLRGTRGSARVSNEGASSSSSSRSGSSSRPGSSSRSGSSLSSNSRTRNNSRSKSATTMSRR